MLQSGEILIILLLALVVLGPRRLPELARKAGQWTRELRAAARDIRTGLEAEVSEIKEVGKELAAPIDEIRKPFKEIGDELTEVSEQGLDWKGPKPVSGPTPEDAMRDLEAIRAQEDESEERSDET